MNDYQLQVTRGIVTEIRYDSQKPPDIFFDTNVWLGMNQQSIAALQTLQNRHGFRYRYTTTNYIELVSHLEEPPSAKTQDPFNKCKSCFRKICELCDPAALPSPEMEFLHNAGLAEFIDPVWIPDFEGIQYAIELLASANSLPEVVDIVKPHHYRVLRDIDGDSLRALMEELSEFTSPITSNDVERLEKWFRKLAEFFLLARPSSPKMYPQHMTQEIYDCFIEALISGVGNLFQRHCITLVIKTVNQRRKVDPNDLYDMMQLILLRNKNRLFVTSDKVFFSYRVEDHRVIPWKSFLASGE